MEGTEPECRREREIAHISGRVQASRTARQSLDIGVVMGKTMRELLACPSRGRPGARARTSFLFFLLDNSIFCTYAHHHAQKEKSRL